MKDDRQARALRGANTALPILFAATLLAGCTEPVPPPTGAAAAVVEAAQAEPYPDLARVPARPRLTYTVAQRREIVRGLVADREQARYEGESLRHRLLGAPPPQPPTLPAAEPPAWLPFPPPASDEAAFRDPLRSEARRSSLRDFLTWLLAPAASDPTARAAGGDHLDGVQPSEPSPLRAQAGEERKPTAAPPAATRTGSRRLFGLAGYLEELPLAPSMGQEVEFALPDEDIPAMVRERLRAWVAEVGDARLQVTAEGDTPALSLERARKVARALVAFGVAPARIVLRPSGPGQRVRVERLEAVANSQ